MEGVACWQAQLVTPRQQEYLSEMRRFYNENDMLPPVDRLAKIMSVHPNAAQEALKRLELAGVIQKNSVNKWMFARSGA